MTRRRKYLLLLTPLALLLMLLLVLASSWGLALALRIAAAVLPGELSVARAQGTLFGPLELTGLRFSNDAVTVSVQQLALDWHAQELLSGKLAVTSLQVTDLSVDVQPQPAATDKPQTPSAIVLPLAIELGQATVRNLQIRTAQDEPPVVIDQIQLRATASHKQIVISQAAIAAYALESKFSGNVTLTEYFPLNLDVALRYQLDATRHFSTHGTLKGDLRKLQLSQQISGSAQANLEAEATALLTQLQWQARLEQIDVDLPQLLAQAQAIHIQGALNARGDLNTLQVESQLRLADRDVGVAQVKLRGDSNLVFSDYRFNLDGEFSGIEVPDATFTLQGQGDHTQLAISRVAMAWLQGKVHGAGQLSWLPYFAVDAELALENVTTGVYARTFPGHLNGKLMLHTDRDAANHPVHISLRDLKGDIRAYPLAAKVEAVWADQVLELNPLQLTIGETRVFAQGKLAQQWDLAFDVHSENLNSLWPTLKGKLALTGQVAGSADRPRLVVKADGSQLAYGDISMDQLQVNLDLGVGPQAAANAEVLLTEFASPAGHWGRLQLHSAGTNAAHVIVFDANNTATSVHTRVRGRFEPWRWQGTLEQLSAEETHIGKWQLQAPAAFMLAQHQLNLSRLCLARNGSHVCTEVLWNQDKQQAMLDGKAIPLALLAPWLPGNIEVSGELDVHGRMFTLASDKVQAVLDVQSADKSIVVNFPEINERLVLGTCSVKAVLDRKGLDATVHLPLSEGGGIDSQVNLPGWSLELGFPRAQPLQASIKLERIPADTITRFIPDMARAQGNLQADLAINGRLGEPTLHGSAAWRGGAMLIPAAGIHVQDVNVELRSAHANIVEFHATARSGKGELKLEGQTRLEPAQGWPTRATLTSQNLEVMNIPEAYVIIDSRIQAELQGNTLNIDGEVTVPHAILKPRKLPEGITPLSRDVVIIREDEPQLAETRWLVNSRLRVKLGDLVNFDGFEIRGKLRGNLLLIDEPEKLATGQGEISIEDGIYRMRGQDLSIRRGRLIFSNTFIDDPGIDVEAIRTIDTIVAGVRLKGTLKKPQLSIFSEPTMTESEALSYLILGHAPSQSTTTEAESARNTAAALGFVAGDLLANQIGGQLGLDELRVDVGDSTESTALVLGKYLSPKLYLRYLSGLVESSSIVQLEYQFSRHVQFQTEAGYRGSQAVSGADIFFTIEY